MEHASIKLHAFLAHAGIASRRKSETLIVQGKVRVNGKVVTNVATRVDPEKDRVEYAGKPVKLPTQCVYYALNKPVGYVSAVSDSEQKKTVTSLVPQGVRVYPVGRLDEDSEGLMLVTNDGELAYALTHPKFEVQKIYHVLVKGAPSNTALNTLRSGVKLKDGMTAPAEVHVVKHDRSNTWIAVGIHEGRNRQVRRMCGTVGLEVLRLVRMSIGPLELGSLKTGKFRPLSSTEVAALKHSVVR